MNAEKEYEVVFFGRLAYPIVLVVGGLLLSFTACPQLRGFSATDCRKSCWASKFTDLSSVNFGAQPSVRVFEFFNQVLKSDKIALEHLVEELKNAVKLNSNPPTTSTIG